MKKYTHSSYSYVYVVEIDKDEIETIDFAACKEPRETLGSYYNRQTKKPDVLINAGFFGMSNGVPCFSHIDEGVARSYDLYTAQGMGTAKGAADKLLFGKVNDGTQWKDFLSAYPVLLDGNGPKTSFSHGSEINYNAVRSVLAMNDKKIFIVHIGKPGMKFKIMSSMLYNMGATYAINLDGGGSSRMLVNGSVFGKPTENRSVDNVLAVYLKKVAVPEDEKEDDEIAADAPYISYTVKKGDSWWKIAQTQLGNGSRYKELMAFNGVKNATLRVGQVVKIPAKEYSYTVKKGDSWWKIAQNEMGSGMRYKELAAYNGKSPSATIYAGQVLKIPV